MLPLIDKKKLFFYLIIFILLSTQIGKNEFYKKKNDYKVNQIKVYGLSIEENLKVSENLNFLLFKNIFFLDKDIFFDVLLKNNLIENFSIKKIYPNIISVDIKKTEFGTYFINYSSLTHMHHLMCPLFGVYCWSHLAPWGN